MLSKDTFIIKLILPLCIEVNKRKWKGCSEPNIHWFINCALPIFFWFLMYVAVVDFFFQQMKQETFCYKKMQNTRQQRNEILSYLSRKTSLYSIAFSMFNIISGFIQLFSLLLVSFTCSFPFLNSYIAIWHVP